MRLEVDDGALLLAADLLTRRATEVRDLVGPSDRVADGLADPALRPAVAALADSVSDAFEITAADLELLARRVRAGALLYGRVEHALGGALGVP